MRLTVLGKSPSWEDAGGACSGYLVEADATAVLIDCGNGVFGKLRERIDYLEVDAVVVSHIHADHILDLVPFAYALTYSPRRLPAGEPGPAAEQAFRPALHLPPGGRERMRRLVGSWGNEDLIDIAFEVSEYQPGVAIDLGPIGVVPTTVPHFTATHALTVVNGEARFTFSADCGPNDALIDAARGSALLLAEATVRRPDGGDRRGHLTPAEAGAHATAAGVRRLVLTHISDELDPAEALAAAEAEFSGQLEIAAEGAVYEL